MAELLVGDGGAVVSAKTDARAAGGAALLSDTLAPLGDAQLVAPAEPHLASVACPYLFLCRTKSAVVVVPEETVTVWLLDRYPVADAVHV